MGNIRLYGSTSGYTELAPPAVAPDGVLSLPSGTGTIAKETGAWTSWTPTWSGITLGNSTVDAAYVQFGKTVTFRLSLTVGSTASGFGRIVFSLPIPNDISFNDFSVNGTFVDINLATGFLIIPVIFDDNVYCDAATANTTYVTRVGGSSTVPFTTASGDILRVTGTYEAA
jgi:hypothetical protein